MDNNIKIIKDRRHSLITNQSDIWELNRASYIGGAAYITNNNLIRYHRESTDTFENRQERSVYINHVQPIVNILTGFIYSQKPERNNLIPQLKSFIELSTRDMDFNSMMQNLCIQSFLYPIILLIDSPQFEDIKTLAQRKEAQIAPYTTIYKFNEIRDFYFNSRGELEWLLLDNTFNDKSNPFITETEIKRYRLWTKSYYQDFTFITDNQIEKSEQYINPLGEIPAVFLGWKSLDTDKLQSSIFETVSLLSKTIYNLASAMDENIYGGSFKFLFYPSKTGDLPQAIEEFGLGSLPIVPFDGSLTGKPFFDGSGIGDVTPYLSVIQLYTKEIMRQLGMQSPEDERKYYDSGIAKSLEFRKTASILKLHADELEATEKEVLRLVAKWEGREYQADILYQKDFEQDSIDIELERLFQAFALPYDSLQKAVSKRIVDMTLPDLTDQEKNDIDEEIEQSTQIPSVNDYIRETDTLTSSSNEEVN